MVKFFRKGAPKLHILTLMEYHHLYYEVAYLKHNQAVARQLLLEKKKTTLQR